jgi:site-specific DNA-methyltransferase (adenine-specific)
VSADTPTIRRFSGLHSTATLYLGDCLEIAPTLEGVDAVISDPPYGMNWDVDTMRFSGGKSPNVVRGNFRSSDLIPVRGDDKPFDPSPWLEYETCVLWGSNHYANRLPIGTTLIWLKRHPELYGSFLSDADMAWMKTGRGLYCYYKQFPPPIRAMEAGGDPCNPLAIHPTQKPIGLMAWCMDTAKAAPGSTVLDPYMGSGTTGIACLRTGRNFIGIEIDPKHFQTACDRMAREIDGQLL